MFQFLVGPSFTGKDQCLSFSRFLKIFTSKYIFLSCPRVKYIVVNSRVKHMYNPKTFCPSMRFCTGVIFTLSMCNMPPRSDFLHSYFPQNLQKISEQLYSSVKWNTLTFRILWQHMHFELVGIFLHFSQLYHFCVLSLVMMGFHFILVASITVTLASSFGAHTDFIFHVVIIFSWKTLDSSGKWSLDSAKSSHLIHLRKDISVQ